MIELRDVIQRTCLRKKNWRKKKVIILSTRVYWLIL